MSRFHQGIRSKFIAAPFGALSIAAVLVTYVACHQTPTPPLTEDNWPALAARATTPVIPLRPSFDLQGTKSFAVYWILGFLDEYLGRQVGGAAGLISHLYCNEHDKAPAFWAALSRLHEEQQLDDPPRESVVQECLIYFHSTAISAGLNSMYVNREQTGMIGGGSHIIALYSSQRMFESVGRQEQLAFVAGAYYRWGRDDTLIGFANSEHKAALVAELLRELGAQDVVHETLRGYIPNGNVVRFLPTAELIAAFGRPPA